MWHAALATLWRLAIDGDRLYSYKMGRAAADDRSRSKSSCNANAAAPRAWQYNRQALQLFELLACNGNFLWEGVRAMSLS